MQEKGLETIFVANLKNPSPYSPNRAERPINKGFEKMRYSPTYSPRCSPDQSPTLEFIGLGEWLVSEIKWHDGEVLGEVCGEYPGEYVAMTNRAQSPCRRAFRDSWVSMVSIFLNSLSLGRYEF